MTTQTLPDVDNINGKLSTLDRLLPIWVIAVGLLVMMYPVLARVRYDRTGVVLKDRRLLAGFLTRTVGERTGGRDWYGQNFLPRIGPWALYGLLFTIVVLFALQGDEIIARPFDVARIALPLLVYFLVVFGAGMVTGRLLGLGYAKTTTLAFPAAGNNFELAIAVAIGTYGVASGQAHAGIVGPLIEVPVLVALVYVALWARTRFFPADQKENIHV